jgi:hypothetical protein
MTRIVSVVALPVLVLGGALSRRGRGADSLRIMSLWTVYSLLSVALLLVASACSGSNELSELGDTPDEYVLFDSASGFTVELPPEWIVLDLTLDDFDEAIADIVVRAGDPQAQQALREAMDSAQPGMVLFALSPDGRYPQINIVRGLPGLLDSVDKIEDLSPASLESGLGVTVIGVDRFDVSGSETVVITYDIAGVQGDIVSVQQAYLLTDNLLYVMTFGSTNFEADKPTFLNILSSFRFV